MDRDEDNEKDDDDHDHEEGEPLSVFDHFVGLALEVF